jgi:hypothetical protein
MGPRQKICSRGFQLCLVIKTENTQNFDHVWDRDPNARNEPSVTDHWLCLRPKDLCLFILNNIFCPMNLTGVLTYFSKWDWDPHYQANGPMSGSEIGNSIIFVSFFGLGRIFEFALSCYWNRASMWPWSVQRLRPGHVSRWCFMSLAMACQWNLKLHLTVIPCYQFYWII